MKFKILIMGLLIGFLSIKKVLSQDTLFLHKKYNKVIKYAISEIDSITFKKSNFNNSNFNNDLSSSDSLIDIDGNKYSTIKIGNQIWMQENLRVEKFNDGTQIFIAKDSADWVKNNQLNHRNPMMIWGNNLNDSKLSLRFGGNYNAYVIKSDKNICPLGWRVPSDYDWRILETTIVRLNLYNDTALGIPMQKIAKALSSKEGWMNINFSYEEFTIGDSTILNNKSKFNILPAGGINYKGMWYNNGFKTYGNFETDFWISDFIDFNSTWCIALWANSSKILRLSIPNASGINIRCIKD
ncbi:MAG: hypothetical protein RLZZ175_265 [Bacteroidota bacterium]|jgi:uncharacterized protein (TIGR02145 family)